MKTFCKIFEFGDNIILVTVDIIPPEKDGDTPKVAVVSTVRTKRGFIRAYRLQKDDGDFDEMVGAAVNYVDAFTQEQAEDEFKDILLHILRKTQDVPDLPPGTFMVPGGNA